MRQLPILLIIAPILAGCTGTKGMKVDNPVLPPPPPRIERAQQNGDGEPLAAKDDQDASEPTQSAPEEEAKPEVVQTEFVVTKPPKEAFTDGFVVATVNQYPIFAGELLEKYRIQLEQAQPKMSADQFRQAQEDLIKRELLGAIEIKIRVVGLKDQLKAEQLKQLEKYLGEDTDKKLQDMMQQQDVGSLAELEAKLKPMGFVLANWKRSYTDNLMAQQFMALKAQSKFEPSREDLLEYYNEHLTDYEFPAEVKWQQIVVSDSVHKGTDKARRALNKVIDELIEGKSFEQVAKDHSDGPTAKTGGMRDRSPVDGLKDKELKKVLLEAPVNDVSDVIRTETGFQIVKVVDRRDADRTPFEDVQEDIKKKLKMDHSMHLAEAAVKKLKESASIVTIFDEEKSEKPEGLRMDTILQR